MMIEILMIGWILWMTVTLLHRSVRYLNATRTFNARRQVPHFRHEPFLWMRRIK